MSRRIETGISRTAEFTCACRASSYYESVAQYRSDDYVAAKMVPTHIRWLLRSSIMRTALRKWFFPSGMYEYVIARTKYIDREMALSLEQGCDQVLILGAGYDSRVVRFAGRLGATRVFELDALLTQQSKIERYREMGITAPANLVFVSIDFDKQLSQWDSLYRHSMQAVVLSSCRSALW